MTWIALVPTLLLLWPLSSMASVLAAYSERGRFLVDRLSFGAGIDATFFVVIYVVLWVVFYWVWTKYFQVITRPGSVPPWVDWLSGSFRSARLHALAQLMAGLLAVVIVLHCILSQQIQPGILVLGAVFFSLFHGLSIIANPKGPTATDYYLPPLPEQQEAVTETFERDFTWVFEPPDSGPSGRKIPLTLHLAASKALFDQWESGGPVKDLADSPLHLWPAYLNSFRPVAANMARVFRQQTNVNGLSPFDEVMNCLSFCQTCFRASRLSGPADTPSPPASPFRLVKSGVGTPEERAILAAAVLRELDHPVILVEYGDLGRRTIAVAAAALDWAVENEEGTGTGNRFFAYRERLYAYVGFDSPGGGLYVGEIPAELSTAAARLIDLAY